MVAFHSQMLPVRRVQTQILRAVICRVMVQVVDDLARAKPPAQLRLHHHDVLQHVPVRPCPMMVRLADQDVALPRLHIPPALPIGIAIPRHPPAAARDRAEQTANPLNLRRVPLEILSTMRALIGLLGHVAILPRFSQPATLADAQTQTDTALR